MYLVIFHHWCFLVVATLGYPAVLVCLILIQTHLYLFSAGSFRIVLFVIPAFLLWNDFVVSEAAVCVEAEELEMQTERYVQDLQQALTETENSTTYSFALTPSPPDHCSTVTLAYEKVQKDISVSYTTVISLHSISVWNTDNCWSWWMSTSHYGCSVFIHISQSQKVNVKKWSCVLTLQNYQ